MAKQLKDILKQAHDTIKGVRSSTTTELSLGKDPGVDYKPKAGDEQEFVAKHSVQKFDDPYGNPDYSKSVKHALDGEKNHGYKKPEDKKVNESKKAEDATCNMSEAGKWCPIHETGECKSMTKINEKDLEEGKYNWDKAHKHGLTDTQGNRMLYKKSMPRMGETPKAELRKLVAKATHVGAKITEKKMKEDILPGTFVEPSAAAKAKANQIQQGQADKAVVSRASMGITTEKTLTSAEKKKREEVAQAIHRENPKMPMGKKMAIATATAKKVAEEAIDEVSMKTMGSYITKASAATTDKTLSDKKVRNRYAGVALADKKMNKKLKEDLAVPLLGGQNGDGDESAEMAKSQLKALASKAMDLANQIPDSMMIEPWVQAKIANAKLYVTDVHDYMVYGDHEKDKEPENETMDTPITLPNMSVDVNTGQNV